MQPNYTYVGEIESEDGSMAGSSIYRVLHGGQIAAARAYMCDMHPDAECVQVDGVYIEALYF